MQISPAAHAGNGGPEKPKGFFRRITLSQWIIVSMVVGIALGAMFPESARDAHGGWAATDLNVLSTIFLRMIKSLIVPLLFSTLVVGIAGHGDDMKKVGKLAFRSILYFEIVTTLALAVGLIAVNLVRPGEGVGLDTTAQVSATVTDLSQRHVTFSAVLEHIVPSSFVDAAAKNEVLQVVFWSIIFAVAVSRTPAGPKR